MSNFPVVSQIFKLLILKYHLQDQNLENTQRKILKKDGKFYKMKSIVLGGGHEVTFAHYSGIIKAFPTKNWHRQSLMRI